MSEARLKVFGIRHHGPGSAASLIKALDETDPSIVLIEGPPDANEIINLADRPGMRPPLAILVYAAEDAAKAIFDPFAEYSPEWQAILWALRRQRPVRFIDLPAAYQLAPASEEREEESDAPLIRRDPLTALAEAAGESDGESWWNALVEQTANDAGVFSAIAQAMTAVRQALEEEDPSPSHRERQREEQREAHMRLEIGRALAATDGAVAVVCGAWHVPALQKKVPAKQDKEQLKPLTKIKTIATWVPWTDSRLAAASGYGAGIISPGWYRHLWHDLSSEGARANPTDSAARWQSRVAGLLRGEGLPAATASVIEAARLSLSLASVRGYPVPGLKEMQDASLAVLCHGDTILLRLIDAHLVIGNEIGEIDASVPQMPLAEDLAYWQKKLRMKPSASEEEMAVDLRSETGLLKSTLLHRLLLINVPWGQLRNAQAGRGTFREVWQLLWQPEYSVKLAEALRYGTTIEQAAGNAALAASQNEAGLARCAELIGNCLNADLPAAAEALTARLQALSVNAGDLAALMLAVAPLANILRYGTARRLLEGALTSLVAGMSAEICAGLGAACRGLNDEAANAMFAGMQSFDGAVQILDDPYHRESWTDALEALERDDQAAAFLRGYALRRLHDAQRLDESKTAERLARALSPAVPTQEAGQWLEGFLAGAAQILLHDTRLFSIIDQWLCEVPEEAFVELLPVFRRAVGTFDAMERRRLLEIAKRGAREVVQASSALQEDQRADAAFAKALPLLKTILGLTDDAA
ncbi:MAG: hypothetical protein JNJ53_13730 [Rhizobiales bacterium]|nr:hypothetical protein [Hyphomicrobiales bacterium]